MAFLRKGADLNQQIKVLSEVQNKVTASESKIICPHCNKVIGTKTGDIFAILDKRFVKLAGQSCPKCGKIL